MRISKTCCRLLLELLVIYILISFHILASWHFSIVLSLQKDSDSGSKRGSCFQSFFRIFLALVYQLYRGHVPY